MRPRRSASTVWGWATAAAAMLALALVIGLRPAGVSVESIDGPTALGIVRPAERGAVDPNVIALRPDAATVTLGVVVDLPGSAFPASIELLDSDGSVIVRDTVHGPEALVDGLFFAITCSVRRCPTGSYAVRIAAGTPEEHRIPLSLRYR